jgi:hypothetical protein
VCQESHENVKLDVSVEIIYRFGFVSQVCMITKIKRGKRGPGFLELWD